MDFGNVGMMIFPIWSGKSSNSCSKPPTRLDEIWVIHIIWFSIYHLGIEQKYFFGEMNGIYHQGFHSTIKEGFTIWVFHIAMGDCPFSSMIVIFFLPFVKIVCLCDFPQPHKITWGQHCLTTLWCRCVLMRFAKPLTRRFSDCSTMRWNGLPLSWDPYPNFACLSTYPLVMTNIANWKITIFYGKTHYFYGHFP